MADVFHLDRIDAVPNADNFSFEMQRWLNTFVDTINTTIEQIEKELNLIGQYVTNTGLTCPSGTTVEITGWALISPNGTFWYDTTTNQIKAKSNGIVVVVV